jgi:hypothetical protein
MIKSPCKSCHKYESGFPECFETCMLLEEIQLHNVEKDVVIANSRFIPTEPHEINIRNRKIPME